MRVRVKLFAGLGKTMSDALPGTPFDVTVVEGAKVDDLIEQLDLPRQNVKVVFVNGRSRPNDWALADADEVGIFPLVGGG